jgi:Family of unknown function (DUF6152)
MNMKRHSLVRLAAAVCFCAAGLPLYAHHSHDAIYDRCKSVTIEGEVVNIEWKNPHVWIALKLDDGTAYRAEWAGLQGLAARGVPTGVEAGALKMGDRVAITGSAMRDTPQVRAAYPSVAREPVLRVVDVTQIRPASGGWNWAQDPGPNCGRQ